MDKMYQIIFHPEILISNAQYVRAVVTFRFLLGLQPSYTCNMVQNYGFDSLACLSGFVRGTLEIGRELFFVKVTWNFVVPNKVR